MRLGYLVFLFFIIIIIGLSCGKEKYEQDPNLGNCDLSDLRYTTDIKPIIDNNCAISGCHAEFSGANNFDFTTYDGLKKGIGAIVNRIDRNINDSLYMPQNKSVLSPCDYAQLKAWIGIGAPY